MMRQIDLEEYVPGEFSLSTGELEALSGEAETLHLSIEYVRGGEGVYRIRPGSTVGAVEIGDLAVLIEPKIGIPQLLSLACYAIGKVEFRKGDFDFRDKYALPDVLALSLASHARRAFSRGAAPRLPHRGRSLVCRAGADQVR